MPVISAAASLKLHSFEDGSQLIRIRDLWYFSTARGLFPNFLKE